MRYTITIISLLIICYCRAQERTRSGEDALKDISWVIEAITLDDTGAMSNYERFEYELTPSDRIVIFVNDHTESTMVVSNTVPESCLIWSSEGISSMIKKDNALNDVPIDSVQIVDNEKLNRYYLENAGILKIDTIHVSGKIKLFDDSTPDFTLLNRSLYYYDQRHNYELAYYRVDELKGVFITDHFRLKYEGWWRYGEKDGKWKEYDKTGKLISVKKYKHGKLVRSRIFK